MSAEEDRVLQQGKEEIMIETEFQIDLRVPLADVQEFFEINKQLQPALSQDRSMWLHKEVVNGTLVDALADWNWGAEYNPNPDKRHGIKHYSPHVDLRDDFTGGATPWPLVCFALQHKEVMLGFEHRPKVVVGPGILFDLGYADVYRTAQLLFQGDEHQAAMWYDRKWGSYRRYIHWCLVDKFDPAFVEFKSDGSQGQLEFWGEPLYPRILMIK